jgi:hypothetical protein
MKLLGHRFLCLRDTGFEYYRKGKIYKSEKEGCITDEQGCKEHFWSVDKHDYIWKAVFTLIGNKRRSGKWRL